jgi:hypothetical protein
MVAESQVYEWPRWRGPAGNGISQETEWNPKALAGGPRMLWKAAVGNGYSSVAIKGNRLYTMGVNILMSSSQPESRLRAIIP